MLPELVRPIPNGLVRDDNAAGRQRVLNHTQPERKAKIHPNRVGDHFGGRAVATIERITDNV